MVEDFFNPTKHIFICFPHLKVSSNKLITYLKEEGILLFALRPFTNNLIFRRERTLEVLESTFYLVKRDQVFEPLRDFLVLAIKSSDENAFWKINLVESSLYLLNRTRRDNFYQAPKINSDPFQSQLYFSVRENLKVQSSKVEGKSSNFIFQSDSFLKNFYVDSAQEDLDLGSIKFDKNFFSLWKNESVRKSMYLFLRANFNDSRFNTPIEDLIKLISAFEALFSVGTQDEKRKVLMRKFAEYVNFDDQEHFVSVKKSFGFFDVDIDSVIKEESSVMIGYFYDKRNDFIHGNSIFEKLGYKYLNGIEFLKEFYVIVLRQYLSEDFGVEVNLQYNYWYLVNMLLFEYVLDKALLITKKLFKPEGSY